MTAAFISAAFPLRLHSHLSHNPSRTATPRMCTPPPQPPPPPPPPPSQPQPPRDPTELRTESEIRRNQPVKPMRRRPRRRQVDDPIDWDNIPNVPIVRSKASPESGEDYWMDLNESSATLAAAAAATTTAAAGSTEDVPKSASVRKPIDDKLKNRLKKEVVSPYTENWILRVTVFVLLLIVLVAIFGGLDQVPIIPVPDL